jgi:DNA-binding transcriptional regulator YhcF (GntR family)
MPSRRATIAESLRQRIVAGLHLGTLEPGHRLPSLRVLGAELRTDPRVVMAAYRQLAAEGLVRLRPRSGVFVEAPPRRDEELLLPEVATWLVDVFLRGLSRDIPPTELRRQARACLDSVRVRAACLECNDDQIHALREQVRRDYGFDAVSVDVDALARREPLPPDALRADLVLTTRFHSTEAERLGKRLRRPVLVATLDPVFITEVRAMLARGPVWWLCTDPRFAAKLPRMVPGSSVKPVVLGRRPPAEIPPGDTVYATRRAAERLPPGWHGGRVVTIPRVFSADTARALLVFLVRRNLQAARECARRRSPSLPWSRERAGSRRPPGAASRSPRARPAS